MSRQMRARKTRQVRVHTEIEKWRNAVSSYCRFSWLSSLLKKKDIAEQLLQPRKFKLFLNSPNSDNNFITPMHSLKASNISQTRKCQNYVKKLNKQIQLISTEVQQYNQRQNSLTPAQSRPSSQPIRLNLKTLSEPKWQHIILEKQLNPEHPKIEVNTKISKLFRNCSTFTQSDFEFRNVSRFFKESDGRLANTTEVKGNSQKLNRRLQMLERSWNRVQSFRYINDMNQTNVCSKADKRTKSILQKIEKKRPRTTNTVRTKIIEEQLWRDGPV